MDLTALFEVLKSLGIVGIVVVIGSIIKIQPLQVNLWGWLALKIGNAFNRDMLTKLDQVQKKQDEIEQKLDGHIADNEMENALNERREILTFARQILSGQKHTRESFVEALSIIDSYERYCDKHPGFANNRIIFAIDLIKSNYRERLEKADFLAEPQRAQKYKEKGVELK